MTYYISFISFFKHPNLNACQARWIVLLGQFHYEIRYLKGRENCVFNVLGRIMHYVDEISYSQVEYIFSKLIK